MHSQFVLIVWPIGEQQIKLIMKSADYSTPSQMKFGFKQDTAILNLQFRHWTCPLHLNRCSHCIQAGQKESFKNLQYSLIRSSASWWHQVMTPSECQFLQPGEKFLLIFKISGEIHEVKVMYSGRRQSDAIIGSAHVHWVWILHFQITSFPPLPCLSFKAQFA